MQAKGAMMPCTVDPQWERAEEARIRTETRHLQHMLMQLCDLAKYYPDFVLPKQVATWQSKARLLEPKSLDVGLEKTTQMLCATCRAWEKAMNPGAGVLTGIKGLDLWWTNHQKSDMVRRVKNRRR